MNCNKIIIERSGGWLNKKITMNMKGVYNMSI